MLSLDFHRITSDVKQPIEVVLHAAIETSRPSTQNPAGDVWSDVWLSINLCSLGGIAVPVVGVRHGPLCFKFIQGAWFMQVHINF